MVKNTRHAVDIHVGKKIRYRRWMVGMTQTELAVAVNIKFQQIQKYETAANRVSASRLHDIAVALETPVYFFFDGLESGEIETKFGGERNDRGTAPVDNALVDKHALAFVRYAHQLPEGQRSALVELARTMARET